MIYTYLRGLVVVSVLRLHARRATNRCLEKLVAIPSSVRHQMLVDGTGT